MPRRVAMITIGQSPRTDMHEMLHWLGSHRDVFEAGALDGLTPSQVAAMAPGPDDYTLVTRLRDGSSVTIAEHLIIDRIQTAIDAAEAAGAEVVLLVCTGEFPPFRHRRPLLTAHQLLLHGVFAIASGARVAVACPAPEQIDMMKTKWTGLSSDLLVTAASPYGDPGELQAAAAAMRDWGPDFVVMDCMGYTQGMKEAVSAVVGAPVLLARSVVARLAAEVVE